MRTVPTRRLGDQGLEVPAIALGCMGLTVFYGEDTLTADPHAVINRAIDLGVNLVDTSDAYGPFTNERVVGDAIKHRRDEVILSTKFGVVRREGQDDGLGAVGVSGRPEYAKQACDASL